MRCGPFFVRGAFRGAFRAGRRRSVLACVSAPVGCAVPLFVVVVEREADGGFSAWVPDLPGCASQGASHAEAVANVREAVACHLAGLRADAQSVPAPRCSIELVDVDLPA